MAMAARGGTANALAALALLIAAPALAEDDDPAEALAVHGFVSQGFIKTTENEYLAHSKRGSFEFTEVGINFTKGLTNDVRVGLQIFAQDLGPSGNYRPQLDWFYLDWRYDDWLGIRAGRSKIPFGLYNESADVDAARVPVLLPQSVYPIDHRDYLLAQTGGELYGNVRLGPAGALEYRGYAGTLAVGTPEAPGAGITISGVDVPYVVGARLLWNPPLSGLTLGVSYQSLRLDWKYHFDPALVPLFQSVNLLPAEFDRTLAVQFNVEFWVASAEYQLGDLLLASEYSRWIGEFESAAPRLLPARTVNERYYAMVSYRVAPWFTPGAYYSAYYPNVHRRGGRAAHQHDVALSFRYDLNQNWLLKLEGHWLEGTAALDNKALNDGKDATQLEKRWGMLLVKTTAYF